MQTVNGRILCVDDDEETCVMLKTLLGGSNYEVTTSLTVTEAMMFAFTRDFDLFVIDNRLSDASGVDFCERLRELFPRTPVVFYSGAAYESDRRQGLCAGAEAYLQKPEVDGLLLTVNGLLAGRCAALSTA